MPDLTPRQQRFVSEFLVDHRGGPAARRAGYASAGSRVTAHKLLTRHNGVRAAITAAQALDSQRLQIERQDVIEGLLEAVADAKAQGNPMAMISGLREIGRMLGFYEPEVKRVEIADDANGTMRRMEAMSDSELLAIISSGTEA
jgi:hypothetical protein